MAVLCYDTNSSPKATPEEERHRSQKHVIKTAWEANRSAANSNDPKRQRLRGIKNEAIKERGG